MLKYKVFKSKDDLVEWANGEDGTEYIISVTCQNMGGVNTHWTIFYIEE